MKILFAASEAYPYAKTGGLADVATSLTNELSRLGHDVKLILPGYPQLCERLIERRSVVAQGELGRLARYEVSMGKLPGLAADIFLVKSTRVYGNTRALYPDDMFNQFARFSLLSHAAANIATGENAISWKPDILHANDWHCGLVFNFLDHFGEDSVARVLSIHNIAFSGRFPFSYWGMLGRDMERPLGENFDSDGEFSFLEEALLGADKINTVSPNYAKEICGKTFGFGFENILTRRKRDLCGILNGVDYRVWHPEQDPHIPLRTASFSSAQKRLMKLIIQRRCGFEENEDAILCSFTNRMTHQKMIDVLIDGVGKLDSKKFQFVFHGQGQEIYERGLRRLAKARNVSFIEGFQEETEHQLLAAADICLSPSRFEPCGLNALYAMRYGALPLVRPVGGYCDSVTDALQSSKTGAGFVMKGDTPGAFAKTMRRIARIYADNGQWRQLVDNATKMKFSWRTAGLHYLQLYHRAERKRATLRDLTPARVAVMSNELEKLAG